MFFCSFFLCVLWLLMFSMFPCPWVHWSKYDCLGCCSCVHNFWGLPWELLDLVNYMFYLNLYHPPATASPLMFLVCRSTHLCLLLWFSWILGLFPSSLIFSNSWTSGSFYNLSFSSLFSRNFYCSFCSYRHFVLFWR